MQNAFRTPSPEKGSSDGNRRHSPWTAQRVRKKGRSSPEPRLSDVQEAQTQEQLPNEAARAELSPGRHARELALHLAQNPFLQGLKPTLGTETLCSLSMLSRQEDNFFLECQASALLPHEQRRLPLNGVCTFPRNTQAEAEVSEESNLRADLDDHNILHLRTHDLGFGQLNEAAVSISNEGETASQLLQPIASAVETLASSLDTDVLLASRVLQIASARILEVSRGFTEPSLHAVDTRSDTFDGGLNEAFVYGMAERSSPNCSPHHPGAVQSEVPGPRIATDVPATSSPACSGVSNQETKATPGPDSLTPSIAPTPSPGMPAPGLQLNTQGRPPPRVPTSCRTIRRVLINSPESCRSRLLSAEDENCKSALQGGSAPMSIDKVLEQPHELEPKANLPAMVVQASNDSDSYQYGSNLSWMQATPEAAEESEEELMDDDSDSALDTPKFVLSRGNITPNNLLPGWDDEEEGPWGPRKGFCAQPLRRSGELSTFDQRLHEAVQNGDAVTLGQAWRDVRSGNVKPNDIDTLNTLLKCYCNVDGSPEGAEEIVKEVCKDGKILPNASTYHHMATLWTRHEQLNNSR